MEKTFWMARIGKLQDIRSNVPTQNRPITTSRYQQTFISFGKGGEHDKGHRGGMAVEEQPRLYQVSIVHGKDGNVSIS